MTSPSLLGARNRTRRQQPPPALLKQMRHDGAERAYDAVEVDLEQDVQPLVVELGDWHVARDRGVRDHDDQGDTTIEPEHERLCAHRGGRYFQVRLFA